MNISVEPGLPGHLFYDAGGYFAVRPVSDGMAAMFLLIPGSGGRDLNDLVAERVGGTDYLRVGGAMYRDSATVPALAKGRTTTRIGPEGLGEWRRITSPGTVGVTGATLWKLYGQDFSLLASGEGPGSATIPAAAGPAWLVAYADPGAALEFIAGGNP
jgi:hypothetical protein